MSGSYSLTKGLNRERENKNKIKKLRFTVH